MLQFKLILTYEMKNKLLDWIIFKRLFKKNVINMDNKIFVKNNSISKEIN